MLLHSNDLEKTQLAECLSYGFVENHVSCHLEVTLVPGPLHALASKHKTASARGFAPGSLAVPALLGTHKGLHNLAVRKSILLQRM